MRILITGADQPLGALAVDTLCRSHELRLTGTEATAPAAAQGLPYTPADLREPEAVAPLVEGVEAVLHVALYAPIEAPDPPSEKQELDTAARGTYVLLHAALKAGVRRFVLASRLELMAAYPPEYAVDETWKPMPDTSIAALAPYVGELTLREFVRAEAVVGICLRFGPLGGAPDGTTSGDAASALERALAMDLEGHKYRWWLYHVCSTDRYALGAAAQAPMSFSRSAEAPASGE